MKLYVGTYKKYNEGSLAGEWIDTKDYSDRDDFLAACYEIHKDEDDPELMFQDEEHEQEWEENFYDEGSAPRQEYWDIKRYIASEHIDEDMLDAWSRVTSQDIEDIPDVKRAVEQYIGKYDSNADFAEDYCRECGDLANVPDLIANNIDWDGVYRDIDCFSDDDYYFDTSR